MQWKILGKFFLHGVLFSLLFLVLVVAWIFVMVLLVSLGAIIGLIIGLGLLFLITGYVNTILGTQVWNIEPRTHGISNIFFHGLALFILLVIVNLLISFLPNHFVPGIATQTITFIISAFINGFIGKGLASWFGHEPAETTEKE